MKRFFFLFLFLFLLAVPVRAEVSLQSYCKDGYYQIPGEKKCSRAPKCGGKTYDELNTAALMPNNNDCLDEGRGMVIGDPPNSSAFYGYYPLCCYEMARLKDPEMCIGYWERLWCHPDQCKEIDNDHGCGGGGCNCAHATKGWCEIRHCTMLPPVPLEVRLHMVTPTPSAAPQPTAAPTEVPQPTRELPTATPVPTTPPVIPTSIPPTSAPMTIPTSSPVNPQPAVSQTPAKTGPALPLQTRIMLRQAVISADKGFKAAGKAVYAVKQADMGLENYINSLLLKLLAAVTGRR